jgi:RNA polymerase sigma-70 factor (ECF subfamily)
MVTTSESLATSEGLLRRLKRPDNGKAWTRFVEFYTPLLLSWSRKAGLSIEDARDHVQEVLVDLVKKLPKFMYNPERGKFRCWLYTVLHNKLRSRRRRREPWVAQANDAELAALIEPPSSFTEHEHLQYLVHRALAIMKEEFETTSWQACWEYIVNDLPAKAVAKKLGITENAVYLAKARIVRRVREEMSDFLV